METCYKCGRQADYICPDCHTKMCSSHAEKRYAGPNRGFRSRYMCPSCWKKKHKVLNENMVDAKNYQPKKYFFANK